MFGALKNKGLKKDIRLRVSFFLLISACVFGGGHPQSKFPSIPMVKTLHGIFFPLFSTARSTANWIPPQQGTSIRVTVMERMSFSRRISVSFSE